MTLNLSNDELQAIRTSPERLVATLMAENSENGSDRLRIQMGSRGRVVYGKLSARESRFELTPETTSLLADALVQPADPQVDAASYQGKRPTIEIQIDGETVFRQERDGIVSLNAVQLQLVPPKELSADPTESQNTASPRPSEVESAAARELESLARELIELERSSPGTGVNFESPSEPNMVYGAYLSQVGDLYVDRLADADGEVATILKVDGTGEIEVCQVQQLAPAIAAFQAEAQRQTAGEGKLDEPPKTFLAPTVEVLEAVEPEPSELVAEAEDPLVASVKPESAELVPEAEDPLVTSVESEPLQPSRDELIANALLRAQELISTFPGVPAPETPEQYLACLEHDAAFWEAVEIEGGDRLAEKRRLIAGELMLFGVEPDSDYRAALDNAQAVAETAGLGVTRLQEIYRLAEASEPGNFLSKIFDRIQAPSALAIAALQMEGLSPGRTQQVVADLLFSAATAREQLREKAAQVQAHCQAGMERLQTWGEKINDRVESVERWRREQQIAKTAEQLLTLAASEPIEQSQPSSVYRAEAYKIVREKNLYLISDLEGNTLMRFKEGLLGFQVLENSLQPQHGRDFQLAADRIERYGLSPLSSATGRQHLGNLAPSGEHQAIHLARTENLIQQIDRFLSSMKLSSWDAGEVGNYNIERQPESGYLRLDLKRDPTGQNRAPHTVLLVEGNQIALDRLTLGDFKHFQQTWQQVEEMRHSATQSAKSQLPGAREPAGVGLGDD